MRTKQEIRESYAKATGWGSWENLKSHSKDLDIHINDLMEMYLQDYKYEIGRSISNPQITEETLNLYAWGEDISFPDDDKNYETF